ADFQLANRRRGGAPAPRVVRLDLARRSGDRARFPARECKCSGARGRLSAATGHPVWTPRPAICRGTVVQGGPVTRGGATTHGDRVARDGSTTCSGSTTCRSSTTCSGLTARGNPTTRDQSGARPGDSPLTASVGARQIIERLFQQHLQAVG